ncbi:MAG: hypothetical protein N4A71_28155 [Carboxylicivirga sp.]|jgi:hypothetical protein|nr:hypothetical protein [Carboxylicivirga sp.]
MIKLLLITTFLIIIPFTSLSQKRKFKEGYIITNKGDTIEGNLKYSANNSLCETVKFKDNMGSDSISIYLPADISSFCFHGKNRFFKSLSYINSSKDTTQGFGELIFENKVSLYKIYLPIYELNDIKYVNDIAYVLEKDDQTYTLLQTRSTYKENEQVFFNNQGFTNTRSYNPVRKEYLGTLTYIFKDYPALKKDIHNARLNDHDIISILKKYLKLVSEQ